MKKVKMIEVHRGLEYAVFLKTDYDEAKKSCINIYAYMPLKRGTLKECTDWLIENGEFEDKPGKLTVSVEEYEDGGFYVYDEMGIALYFNQNPSTCIGWASAKGYYLRKYGEGYAKFLDKEIRRKECHPCVKGGVVGFEDIDNYCKEICELTTERNMIRQSLRETSGLLHRIYLLKYPFLKHMIPMLEEMNCKLEDMYAKEAEKKASEIEKLLK